MDSFRTREKKVDIETTAKKFAVITTSVLQKLPEESCSLEIEDMQVNQNSSNNPGLTDPSLKIQDDIHNPTLDQFNTDQGFYLCCIGYFVGFANVLRFPYMVANNGGAVFLIPYFVCLFVIVVPMFTLELAWGQLVNCKLHQKYQIIHPGLWGLGFAKLWINLTTLPYYTTLLPYTLSYLFESFERPLPWKMEETSENGSLWNSGYFPNQVQERTADISQPGRLVPWLCLMLLVTYVGLYFIMWKGLKSSSNVVMATATVPYFILFILLLKGITLPGSEKGLVFLFVPEWSKLLDLKIWKAALIQVIYSTGITYGPLMNYASARKKNSKILVPSFLLPLVNSGTSLLASITLFCFIGHVATRLEVDIKDISTGGMNLAFTAYPGLMTTLAMPNLWSILFFSMLVLVGVDSVFGMYDFVIAFVWQWLPSIERKMRKEVFVMILVACLMTMGLQFVTTNGWWWFLLFNSYAAGDCLIFILMLKTFAIVVSFGLDKLDAILYARTRERLPWILQICLKYGSTPMMTFLFVYSMYNEIQKTRDPTWTLWFGRCFLVAPMVIVGLGFFYPKKGATVEQLVRAQLGKSIDELVAQLKDAEQLQSCELQSTDGISPKPSTPFDKARAL